MSRQETIHRHLRKCQYQPQPVKDRAYLELSGRGLVKSPSRPVTAPSIHFQTNLPADGNTYIPPLSFALVSSSASVSVTSSSRPSPLSLAIGTLAVPFPAPSPTGSFTNVPSSAGPSPSSSSLLLTNPSPLYPYSPHAPSPLSMSPSINANPLKRARVGSIPRQASFTFANAAWTGDQQARFGKALARITASCGFPYRWVENPEWVKFLNEFLPFTQHISRRQLSDTLIPREVARYRNEAKKTCSGSLATLQCDGWSGINFHHFLAFMITTDKREVSFNITSVLNLNLYQAYLLRYTRSKSSIRPQSGRRQMHFLEKYNRS